MTVNHENNRMNEIHQLRPDEFEIEEIDLKMGPYCMSFGFDLEKYMQSIASVGLMNSPIIISNAHGRMTPVSGYRRLMAIRALGRHKVMCRDITDLKFSGLELFILNLSENMATRTFNEVEKAMIVNGLIRFVPEDRIIDFFMPLLDLAPRRTEFLFYTVLANNLEDRIKGFLVHGDISLNSVRTLLSMDNPSRNSLAEIISDLKLNSNKQKQLIEYLIDLSNHKGKKIRDVLNEKNIRDLLSDKNLNTPQKAKALLRRLRALCFPMLEAAEKEFRKKVALLDLPKGVSLSHPPFFESPHYSMEILFSDGQKLLEHIEDLKRLDGLKEITDPWMGQGDESR